MGSAPIWLVLFVLGLGSEKHRDNFVEDASSEPRRSYAEKEFTRLRIEYIKNQILKKLRLKEKPTVDVGNIPIPVKEYENLLPDQDMNLQEQLLGRLLRKDYADNPHCLKKTRFPSACLPFQMSTDIHNSDVSTAELWFHKEQDDMDSHNQTFVLSEIAHCDTKKNPKNQTHRYPRDQHDKRLVKKVDVTYVVKNWLEYQDSPTHALSVVCKTCGMDKSHSPISRTLTHRRQKRSTNCSPGINECCRESLYISFADIGWDDWIIKPEGYNAYFCRGSCMTASAMTLSATQHNSILQKVMYSQNRRRGGRPELTPCCAATQFQPLQLVYMHSNKTLTTKLLSNMIVETCGCM
ncbi:hypothetical protein NQ318_003433 [Aromia moschata]|uniref:TGF-beta family profile domain-containing protein n=1 Tax=Aromia moschata TaxID=1265417 RepID=A0AAV8YV22_9CUCU|nr:hypothetical protein NQ318_003433 [Aromia moschata]